MKNNLIMKFYFILTYLISILIGNTILILFICSIAFILRYEIINFDFLTINILYSLLVLILHLILYLMSLIFHKISIYDFIERDITFKLSKYLTNWFKNYVSKNINTISSKRKRN
jgi:hypothetical protein